MDSPKSLKVITGIFLLFLGVLAFNTIDSIYIPLKKSIAAEHISAIVFYGTEFLVFFTIGFSINKLIKNINKQNFFIRQNYQLFSIMGIALFLPPLVYMLGNLFDQTHNSITINDAAWFAGSLFMFILAEIFRYGYKLKEEQRRQFVLILSIICYACAATGFLHSLLLCWEMGHNDNSIEFAAIIYSFIPSVIMVWSSVLIALIINNIRKGIVFETSNAQLITWVGAVVLIGGVFQSILYNFTNIEQLVPGNTNHMLVYLLGTFIAFIGQIFHIGIRMKEEQDLTI